MTLPLEGLRIIELSTYVAGPSGAMTLAQLGADVIRVDPIGGATDTRRLPVAPNGASLYWAGLNKGKRSIEIDTRSDEGRELVLALIAAPGAENGILLTNAVGQDWLSDAEIFRRRNDAIAVRILGRSDGKPAVDYTVNCEVGLPWLTGPVDVNRPVNHVLPAWDLLTGLHAAVAILVAERARNRTGQGESISVSLADVAVATMAHLGFVADVVINGRGRARDGNFLHGSFGCDFPTRDGQRVMIVALTPRHWHSLVQLTGMGEAIAALERSLSVDLAAEEARYEYREVLAALMGTWFEQRDYADVVAALEPSGVLWGPYRGIHEFVNDDNSLLHASELMADLVQPGIGAYPTPRSVLNMTGFESARVPAPALGQHTGEVLSSILGLNDRALAQLRASGVIGQEPHF